MPRSAGRYVGPHVPGLPGCARSSADLYWMSCLVRVRVRDGVRVRVRDGVRVRVVSDVVPVRALLLAARVETRLQVGELLRSALRRRGEQRVPQPLGARRGAVGGGVQHAREQRLDAGGVLAHLVRVRVRVRARARVRVRACSPTALLSPSAAQRQSGTTSAA